jgi:hypothetical protein
LVTGCRQQSFKRSPSTSHSGAWRTRIKRLKNLKRGIYRARTSKAIQLVFPVEGSHLDAPVSLAKLERMLLPFNPNHARRSELFPGAERYPRREAVYKLARLLGCRPWISCSDLNPKAPGLTDARDIEAVPANPS